MNLETARLVIRNATTGDAGFFLNLLNEPDYIRNIRDSKVRTIEEAEKFIQDFYLASYERNGFGLYLLELKETKELVGVCGLVKRDMLPYPDLGFALLAKFTGHGYIFESANAIITFAKQNFSYSEIGAITLKSNEKSTKLLKKLKFQFREEIENETTGQMLDLYELSLAHQL